MTSLARESSRDTSHIASSATAAVTNNHASDVPTLSSTASEEKSTTTTSAVFNKEKLNSQSQAQASSSTQFVSEKDKSFTKLFHHLSETKKELEGLQKQRKEWSLESQRLREKCQQLEDRIITETSRCAGYEERLEKSKTVQRSMQTQLDQQAMKIESLSATIEHQQTIIQSLSLHSMSILGPVDGSLSHPHALSSIPTAQPLVKSLSGPPSHGSSPSVTMRAAASTVPAFDGLPPAMPSNILPAGSATVSQPSSQDQHWNSMLAQPQPQQAAQQSTGTISNGSSKSLPISLLRTNSPMLSSSNMSLHQNIPIAPQPAGNNAMSSITAQPSASSASNFLSSDQPAGMTTFSAHLPSYAPLPAYYPPTTAPHPAPTPAGVSLPPHPQSDASYPSFTMQAVVNPNPIAISQSALSSSTTTAASSGNQSPSQKIPVANLGPEGLQANTITNASTLFDQH
jgi:hypothetical protein